MPDALTIIVPVYDAARHLEELHARLTSAAEEQTGSWKIIYVDDGSTDTSFALIEAISRKDSRTAGIKLQGNWGQQQALLCGLRHADSDLVVTIDDDLEYPPEAIGLLCRKIAEGYDLVYGIPRRRSNSPIRSAGTAAVRILLQLIAMKPPGLEVSSFRIMNRAIAAAAAADSRRQVYISAASFLADPKAATVPIDTRPNGESRYSIDRLLKLFSGILLSYTPLLSRCGRQGRQYVIDRAVGLEKV